MLTLATLALGATLTLNFELPSGSITFRQPVSSMKLCLEEEERVTEMAKGHFYAPWVLVSSSCEENNEHR